MKQMQSVQEELRKFQSDYEEFGVWLQQAQEQLAELGAPTSQIDDLHEKLQKQKSFYEDVISHKGDLRFITIAGQKVLDVAKGERKEKPGSLEVDASGTCAAVKEKLDSTATQYKVMHTQVIAVYLCLLLVFAVFSFMVLSILDQQMAAFLCNSSNDQPHVSLHHPKLIAQTVNSLNY